MNNLASKLRTTIQDHVAQASPAEIRLITSLLCADDQPAPGLTEVAAAAASRFEVIGETVVDHRTGLTWTRGNVPCGRVDFEGAKAACESLQIAGERGWRLPTIQELLTLVDYERKEPAIDPAFECESAWYWTATPYAPLSGYAWDVDFDNGYSYGNHRDSYGFVRAVRGGQF